MLYDHGLGAGIVVDAFMDRRTTATPLFSVLSFDKAGHPSVSSGTGANFEMVAVDAAGPRPELGLIDALRRCRGEFIAISCNETPFHADAFSVAVESFRAHPGAGGVCFNDFLTTKVGSAVDNVSIVTLLLASACLYLPAGFFRRSALLSVGLERDDWTPGSVGWDLWCRIATDFDIVTLQRAAFRLTPCLPRSSLGLSGMSRSAAHAAAGAIENRLDLVARHFSRDGFFEGKAPEIEIESKISQMATLAEELAPAVGSSVERLLTDRTLSLLRELHTLLQSNHRALSVLSRLVATRGGGSVLGRLLMPLLMWPERSRRRIAVHAGYTLWNAPHKASPFWGQWLMRALILRAAPASEPTDPCHWADAYALAGVQYEARGQITTALEMWERARPPSVAEIDSLACQATLKEPTATDESLAAVQQAWVERHIRHTSHVVLARRPGQGKVRVGYHCAFMASDTMRYMMRNVLMAHDRSRFEVFGYSPYSVPPDIAECFDVLRLTPAPPTNLSPNPPQGPALTDDEFAHLVRSDGIDVLVELTGFSPGHRFGAMARRCAPVQVSFLNHAGTTCVPNVDYVLSDGISMPEHLPAQKYYSERIYRLPGCFFSFDYADSKSSDITPPPSQVKGYTTFGCFGSGAKINNVIIERWAALLQAVPNSMLHLRNMQLSGMDNRRFMADRFARLGIGLERLILGVGLSRDKLWPLYHEIDISLDTWPYCGGNTIAESLWHGVPVVTLNGDRFAGAYGASLVSAAGCGDLVADTPQRYIEIAVALAKDLPRLEYLRRALRQMSRSHSLGDSGLFARKLEGAFCVMVDRLGGMTSSVASSDEVSTEKTG